MIVASQTWDLSLPGCSSLKAKRSVVRSMKDRLRTKFNASVAETGLQDVHGRAELTIAVVGTDRARIDAVLERADRLVESHGGAVIVGVRRERY